jgi:acetyltransferase-like isoleucine patch superfamily enzyme
MLVIKGQDHNTLQGLATTHEGEVVFRGVNNQLVLGDQVKLEQVKIHFLGAQGRLEIADRCVIRGEIIIQAGARVSIGAGTKMNKPCHIRVAAHNHVQIGAGCLLANVKIHAFESVSLINTATEQRINPITPIEVGDRVWIAENCQLGCGASIGQGTVIGANSVVNTPIAADSLAVGYPARVVKSDIRWAE